MSSSSAPQHPASAPRVGIVGAGPAGLFAAETLARRGADVTVFEAKPSPARKLLMAGRGGLNLTHSEPLERFTTRYGTHADFFAEALTAFPPQALRDWCKGLGINTFVGTSGRVFPTASRQACWSARGCGGWRVLA